MAGYWTPHGDNWKWISTTKPPPQGLVDKWGLDVITDINHHPDNPEKTLWQPPPAPEHPPLPHDGYWTPAPYGGVDGSGFRWETRRAYPPQDLIDEYGLDSLTDPSVFPDGRENPKYVPPDVDVPPVSVKGGWPRDITGDPLGMPAGGGEPKEPPPPTHGAMSASLSSFRDAEASILEAARAAVVAYDKVQVNFNTNRGWMFTVHDSEVLTEPHPKGGGYKYIDPAPETTHVMGNTGSQLLAGTSNVLPYVGDFVLAIDTAAQLLAKADKDSQMPTE